MKITAEQKYIRISPRKLRLVVDGLRGMHPEAAMTELGYMTRNAAEPVRKVIRQALANAVNNLNLNPGSLRISEILVDEGATYKRWQAVSRGRAHSILKRTSSVKVILESVGSVVPTSQPQPAKVTETTTKTEKTKDIKKTAPKKTASTPKAVKSAAKPNTNAPKAKVSAARRTNTNNSKKS